MSEFSQELLKPEYVNLIYVWMIYHGIDNQAHCFILPFIYFVHFFLSFWDNLCHRFLRDRVN